MIALASLERQILPTEVAESLAKYLGGIETTPVDTMGYSTWVGSSAELDLTKRCINFKDIIVNALDIMNKFPTVEFTFKRVPKADNVASAEIEILNKFSDLVSRLETQNFDMKQEINNRVEVHVPNLGLLAVNEVDVLTDMCTEALQEYITKGWRILAICPQPNQRRPDYVIGRTI